MGNGSWKNRTCLDCGEGLAGGQGRPRIRCIACALNRDRSIQKEWRDAHRDRCAQRSKQYIERNRETIALRRRKNYEANREKLLAINRKAQRVRGDMKRAEYRRSFTAKELRPIPGFDGYFADDKGGIWSTRFWKRYVRFGRGDGPPKPVVPFCTDGYLRVTLSKTGQSKRPRVSVHLLVMLAFYGAKPAGSVVRHLNGDSFDNRPCNLAYGTASENSQDRWLHGTMCNDEQSHLSIFGPEERAMIASRVHGGESMRAVARDLGISAQTVKRYSSRPHA